MKIKFDQEACMRYARCYRYHPELFEEGDDGKPLVVVDEPGEALRGAIADAMRECPTQSISLVDDRSGPLAG